MGELILHHYDTSPFAHKVRGVLGFKRMSWRSVTVPVMNPKPDVVALTGGYRRTPFMQIGADIYCDSARVCRLLEQLIPEPTIYPASGGGAMHMVAQWADSALFWAAVPRAMATGGVQYYFPSSTPEFMQAFGADRAALTQGMRRNAPHDGAAIVAHYLGWIEAQLADGRAFLMGAQASIADFSAEQSIWFMRRAPAGVAALAPYPKLLAWADRVLAFGEGTAQALTSTEAIAVAAASREFAPCEFDRSYGFEPGAGVSVNAQDYGADPVAGVLVGISAHESVVERRDERAGKVHVHFPRIGFQLKKETTA